MAAKRNNKGQFVKGVTPNPTGRGGKKDPSVMQVGFSAAENMPEFIKPIDLNKAQQTTEDFQRWGTTNDFPNAIAELNRKSPLQSGLLYWKTIYITGKGFETGESEDSKFNKWIKSCNRNRESLKAVMKKVISDKLDSGNGFLEMVVSGKEVAFYHKDYTTGRISKDGKELLLYGDWANYEIAKKEDIKRVALFPEFTEDEGVKRTIIHFKDYCPAFQYYGVPKWIAGMDAAGIAYKTNKWNISRLDNSFSQSGTLVVEGNFTPKEARVLKDSLEKQFSGEDKQGKVMFVIKSLGGGNTEFTPFTNTSEGEWLELHNQSKEDLLNVHNWFPTLSGNPTSTGFDVGRARVEFQIASNTIIAEEQEVYLDVLKPILSEFAGFNTDNFRFYNPIPFSIEDRLDPKTCLTKNEQREVFGYDPLEGSQNNVLDGKQVDSINNVLASVKQGIVSKESAINLFVAAFNINRDNAKAIVG